MLQVNDSNWHVPSFETALWQGRQHRWCVVIPVINEGIRIQSLLQKMFLAQTHELADIIIVDGGSTDDSLTPKILTENKVAGLLVKTGAGKLSAQLRCAYAFALRQGYDGIVTIDGNDKDDPVAIEKFIEKLALGFDFVQASRFIEGGVAVNTPKSRDLAIRLIHAPALAMSSGFPWTDTTQGFRAYSSRMLLDPEINPFRDCFKQYELLAYLSHRAPLLGYRCCEVGTSRIYPNGEVPTKISAVRGNLTVLTTLAKACVGTYDVPGSIRRVSPPLWPASLICIIGAIFSILAAFPGWMSPDSIDQYTQARQNIYTDWHPVLLAWWWHHLESIYSGPALLLVQNVMMYWFALWLFARGCSTGMGRACYLIPMIGFWPGLLLPLGHVWKDIGFACTALLAWAIIFDFQSRRVATSIMAKFAILALSIFAVGIKLNGAIVLPFLFAALQLTRKHAKLTAATLFISLATTVLVVSVATLLGPAKERVMNQHAFQYTQTYDLLAISVKTGTNFLPVYVKQRLAEKGLEPDSVYVVGGNNGLFYGTGAPMFAQSDSELDELRALWRQTVLAHPKEYLLHRYQNFLSLIRWGISVPAYVAVPAIDENPYELKFKSNQFSKALEGNLTQNPWMFYPWVYLIAIIVGMILLSRTRLYRSYFLWLGGSALAFVAPHFFITPANDYRYLYYAYLCGAVLIVVAFIQITAKLTKRIFQSVI